MLEGSFKSHFLKEAREQYPLAHIRTIPASKYSLLPYDAFILHEGMFRAIEFKMEGRDLKAHQILALNEVIKNGGYSFVVTHNTLSHREKVELDRDNKKCGVIEVHNWCNNEIMRITQAQWIYRAAVNYVMGYRPTPLERSIQGAVGKEISTWLESETPTEPEAL
jgi:hypothetical protein